MSPVAHTTTRAKRHKGPKVLRKAVRRRPVGKTAPPSVLQARMCEKRCTSRKPCRMRRAQYHFEGVDQTYDDHSHGNKQSKPRRRPPLRLSHQSRASSVSDCRPRRPFHQRYRQASPG